MKTITSGNFTAPAVSGETQVRIIDGMKFGMIMETKTLDGSANYDLDSSLPQNAVVVMAQLKLDSVTATTAVKVGIGRKESTADPDKYLLSSALTDGEYGGALVTPVLGDATSAETLQITACATNGASDGTLDTGTVTARVVYKIAEAL